MHKPCIAVPVHLIELLNTWIVHMVRLKMRVETSQLNFSTSTRLHSAVGGLNNNISHCFPVNHWFKFSLPFPNILRLL